MPNDPQWSKVASHSHFCSDSLMCRFLNIKELLKVIAQTITLYIYQNTVVFILNVFVWQKGSKVSLLFSNLTVSFQKGIPASHLLPFNLPILSLSVHSTLSVPLLFNLSKRRRSSLITEETFNQLLRVISSAMFLGTTLRSLFYLHFLGCNVTCEDSFY